MELSGIVQVMNAWWLPAKNHWGRDSMSFLPYVKHTGWQYFHTWINGHARMSLGKYWKTENLTIFTMCDPREQEYMCWARLTHSVWGFRLLYSIWKGKQDCSHNYAKSVMLMGVDPLDEYIRGPLGGIFFAQSTFFTFHPTLMGCSSLIMGCSMSRYAFTSRNCTCINKYQLIAS
jgi:hypothetical protein